jgi:hypothetical protein
MIILIFISRGARMFPSNEEIKVKVCLTWAGEEMTGC